MDWLSNATFLGNVPSITWSTAWLHRSNEWILFICWWLAIRFPLNHTHGTQWEVSTRRRPVERMSDVGGSVDCNGRGWAPKRSCIKTPCACSGYEHLHDLVIYSMTTLAEPSISRRTVSLLQPVCDYDASVTLSTCAAAHRWGWRLVAGAACWPGLAGSGTCWGWRRWQQLHCSSLRLASLVAAAWHLPVEPD